MTNNPHNVQGSQNPSNSEKKQKNKYVEDAFALANAWSARENATAHSDVARNGEARKTTTHKANNPTTTTRSNSMSDQDTAPIRIVPSPKQKKAGSVTRRKPLNVEKLNAQTNKSNQNTESTQPVSKEASTKETTSKEESSEHATSETNSNGQITNEQTTSKKTTSDKIKKNAQHSALSPVKILLAIVVFLIVVLVALITYLSLTRWTFANDSADIQGTWNVQGQDNTVLITEDTIRLTSDATYSYTIDESTKCINETFGNMNGWAHYRISPDKKTLAIIDISAPEPSDDSTYSEKESVTTKNMSWIESLSCDFAWSVGCIFAQITGAQQPNILGDNSGIVLYKLD